MAEGREFSEPVLRDIHRLMTTMFFRQIAEMNKDIMRVLTGGPALHKSLCLEAGEPVLKSRADPLSAGSRGGKWYRDSRGKIRYGDKPTAQGKTRIPDAATAQLEANFQLALSVGDTRCLLNFIAAKGIQLTNADALTLANLGATSRATGSAMRDTFALYLTDVEVPEYDENGDMIEGSAEAPSEDDISYLWNRYVDGWEALSKTDGFAIAMQDATQRIEDQRSKVTLKLGKLTDVVHALATDVLREKPPVTAMKFLASLLLHDWASVGTEAEQKAGHHKVDDSELGRLVISDKGVMEGVVFVDDLSASQILLLVLAAKQHLSSMEMRLSSVGSPDLAFTFQWFGSHFDLTEAFFAAYEEEHGRILTDGEKEKYGESFSHVCKTFFELLDDTNSGLDGQTISAILKGDMAPAEVLNDTEAVEALVSRFTTFQALRAAAVKAQKNEEWDASPRIKSWADPQTLNWMLTVKRGIDITTDYVTAIALTDMLIEQQVEPRAVIIAPTAYLVEWQAAVNRVRPKSRVRVIDPTMKRSKKIRALKDAEAAKAEFIIISQEDAVAYSDETLDKSRKPKHLRDEDGIRVRDEEGALVAHPTEMGVVDTSKLALLHDKDDLVGAISRLRGIVFIDDAHNSIKGKGPNAIAMTNHLQRNFAFLLSATPMRNGPSGMYDMLSVVRPEATGPSKEQWLSRLQTHTIDPATGKLGPTSVGRLAEFASDLAPFVYGTADVEAMRMLAFDSPKHEELFNTTLNEVLVDAAPVLKGSVLPEDYLLLFEKLGELQKVMIAPGLLKPALGKKRSPAVQACIETVMAHCEEAPDKPVVVFSGEPAVFAVLVAELHKEGAQAGQIGVVTLDTPTVQCNAVQDAANIGKFPIVLVGLGAGGASLNLQHSAGVMLFLDRGTSPLDVAEAVGRLQPLGTIGAKAAHQATRIDFVYPHAGGDILQQLTVQAVANLLRGLADGHISPDEFTNLRETFKETFGTDMPTAAKLRREFDMNGAAPAGFPKILQKEFFTPKRIRPLQPETEYAFADVSPYQDGGDLEAFYQMVVLSKATTARDFAYGYLRTEVGEEDWNRAQPPGEASMPEKALGFATEVFRKLLETGGIYERVPDPAVSPLTARGLEPDAPPEAQGDDKPKEDADQPEPE